MGAKFTWHEKFTRALEKVPDEMLPQLVRAVCAYGTDGVEPDLAFPLDVIFEAFRDDIDYSKNARKSGSKGGQGVAGPCGARPSGPRRPRMPLRGFRGPFEGFREPSRGRWRPFQPNT